MAFVAWMQRCDHVANSNANRLLTTHMPLDNNALAASSKKPRRRHLPVSALRRNSSRVACRVKPRIIMQ